VQTLRFDILAPPQRQFWNELQFVPGQFVLYGGTAIALQLGHHRSIDFDFFSSAGADSDDLLRRVPWLRGAETMCGTPDTLTCRVDRAGPIKVSFFGTPLLRALRAPLVEPATSLKLASLLDLAGAKAFVLQQRAEAKDYLDVDALLGSGLSLPVMLAAGGAIFGARFDAQSTLKALSYFGDGDLDTLDQDVRQHLLGAVRAADLEHLPDPGVPLGGIGE
jgi:hypothetical protein